MGVDGNPGGERGECGDGLPLDADGLAGGGLGADGLAGGGLVAGVLAGGLRAGVLAGEDVVDTDNDPSRASKLLAFTPAIHSVSRFLARLRTTFPLR